MATLDTKPEIDPRILRILQKRALRKTWPMVATFVVFMLIIHDIWVTLGCGIFFIGFWFIIYMNIFGFLLRKKYPDKFPITTASNDNDEYWDFNKRWSSDTINNPAYRSLSCNMYNNH